MKKPVLWVVFFCFHLVVNSQTITWNGYPGGSIGIPFNSGTAPYNMTATVTTNSLTPGDGTPRYTATNPGTPCYVAGSLALNANTFGNITTAFYNVSIILNPGFNGSCAAFTFTMRDINSDESVNTFLDIVEISAVDGNSVAIPVGNITITPPANTTVVNVGSVRKIVGHNNASETASSPSTFSSSPCNITTVTITPPAGVPLQSINIRYRPSYGGSTSFSCTSGCAYWNFSGPFRPANQYISISDLTYTPTGGCTPLPIELLSFKGVCNEYEKTIFWSTASETNNDFFTLEASMDAIHFDRIAIIDGSGNSNEVINYEQNISNESPRYVYYRLKQTDFDGNFSYSHLIFMDCLTATNLPMDLLVFPNPSSDRLSIQLNAEYSTELEVRIMDVFGKTVMTIPYNQMKNEGLDITGLNNGLYIVNVLDENQQLNFTPAKFIKE